MPLRRSRGRVLAAGVLIALVGVFIAFFGFDTVDAVGMPRVRTAAFVWSWVPGRLPAVGPAHLVPVLYTTALATVVVGFFALIALAARVDAIEPPAARRTFGREIVAAAIDWPTQRPMTARRWAGAAMAALALFVAWRIGALGAMHVAGVEDTFASFDHPFHLARVETLIRSLLHGRLLRWVANHQGGYPAEFYPFGFAWVEAALWGIAGGALPIAIVHRTAVVLLFVAPALLFAAMARLDGWPPLVGLAAFALHIAVPGDMWGGGYGELVYVGLVANVAASLAVVASMTASLAAFRSGSRRALAVAAACAAAAIWCNPRSAIGLVVCVGAGAAVAVWDGSAWRATVGRLLAIASVAALLAAPELLSLVRFHQLYFFIRYTSYTNVLDYVAATIDAVSVPGFALAGLGLLSACVVDRRRLTTRTTAAALVAYVATTLVFSFGAASMVEQLETTRLMPVQRFLTIYLAAVGLHITSRVVVQRWRAPRWAAAAAQGTAVAALLIVYVGVPRLMPFWSRGLYEVERSGVPSMATFQQVLKVADQQTPPDSAILVVGSAIGAHQQLWAPVRSDRLFFYDDWMWYWQTKHRGPYDPTRKSKYEPERIAEVFGRTYLDENAIGSVVVEKTAQPEADVAPTLQRIFGGQYGFYLVSDPKPVVTFGGSPAAQVSVENERITADGTGGDAFVRRNWFPRWRADVNGRPAAIAETDDGYMRVAVPPGSVHLVLSYALEPLDVAGRMAGVAGLVLLGVLLAGRRRAPAA